MDSCILDADVIIQFATLNELAVVTWIAERVYVHAVVVQEILPVTKEGKALRVLLGNGLIQVSDDDLDPTEKMLLETYRYELRPYMSTRPGLEHYGEFATVAFAAVRAIPLVASNETAVKSILHSQWTKSGVRVVDCGEVVIMAYRNGCFGKRKYAKSLYKRVSGRSTEAFDRELLLPG